jgi:hypothetical protein
VEESVINSQESAQRQVTGFYAEFFHRLPDSLASVWVGQLLSGVSARQVEANILADPFAQEFFKDGQNTVC